MAGDAWRGIFLVVSGGDVAKSWTSGCLDNELQAERREEGFGTTFN